MASGITPIVSLLNTPSPCMERGPGGEVSSAPGRVRRFFDLAVILVEHEMDVIRRVSDRCVVLNFGRKIFEGSFDALIANPDVQTAYLGVSQ